MTTVSYPIFDRTVRPEVLVGVLGIDLLVKDMEAIEPNYGALLNGLLARNSYCPVLSNESTSACTLARLRETDFTPVDEQTPLTTSSLSRSCPSDPTGCTAPVITCPSDGAPARTAVNPDPFCFDSNQATCAKTTSTGSCPYGRVYSASSQDCLMCSVSQCPASSSSSSLSGGAAAGIAITVIVLLLIIAFMVARKRRRSPDRTPARGSAGASPRSAEPTPQSFPAAHSPHPPAPSAPPAYDGALSAADAPPSYESVYSGDSHV